MANGEIIKAAGAAYSIPKVDISGFVKGFTAIATGLINSEKRKTTGEALLTKKSGKINTRFESYKNNAKIVRDDYANGVISLNEASERIDNLASGVGQLNELDQLSKTLYGDNGYSLDIDPIDRAYLTAIRTGQLETPIIVNGKEYPALMAFDKKNHAYTLDQGGDKYRSTEEIINHFSQYATPKEADKLVETANGFTSKNYTDEASWTSAAGEFITTMDKSFKSNKLRNAFLLDNTITIGLNNKISFIDYYLDNSLFSDTEEGEELNLELKKQLDDPNISKDEKDLAKGLLVSQLMKNDKTIDQDVDKFINKIIADKKPAPKKGTVIDWSDRSSFNFDENKESRRIGMVRDGINLFRDYVDEGILPNTNSKNVNTESDDYKKAIKDLNREMFDLKLEFRPVVVDGQNLVQVYKMNFDDSKQAEAVSYPFDINEGSSVDKMLPLLLQAAGVTSGSDTYSNFMKWNEIHYLGSVNK